MGIFTDNFNAGVSGGGTLAQLFQQTRDRNTQKTLAQQFGQDGDFNALGTGLIGLGQAGQGINAINVPYNREQQALQRDFQNQQFEAAQQQNAFQNQLATQGFGLRQQQFQNDQNQQQFSNDLATQRLQIAQQQAESKAQGGGGFTTPFQATDENGNQVFVQANDRGEIKPVEGFAPNNSLTKIDAGDKTLLLDRAGNVVATTNKNNFDPAFDKARGSAEGKKASEFGGLKGKAESSLRSFKSQSIRVRDTADRAIDLAKRNATTGFTGSLLNSIPGTPAFELAQELKTLKANIGFDKLQNMRDNSPTGGALGQVSNLEIELLTAVNGALEQGLNGEALVARIGEIKNLYNELLVSQETAFKKTFVENTGNGISFSRDNRIEPASGDNVPVSEEELQDLLGKY